MARTAFRGEALPRAVWCIFLLLLILLVSGFAKTLRQEKFQLSLVPQGFQNGSTVVSEC